MAEERWDWPSVVNVLRRGGKFKLSALWIGEPPSRMGCTHEEKQYVPLSQLQQAQEERDAAQELADDQHRMVGEIHTQLEALRGAAETALTQLEHRMDCRGGLGTEGNCPRCVATKALRAALNPSHLDPCEEER